MKSLKTWFSLSGLSFALACFCGCGAEENAHKEVKPVTTDVKPDATVAAKPDATVAAKPDATVAAKPDDDKKADDKKDDDKKDADDSPDRLLPKFPWPPPVASSWMKLPAELLHRPGRRESMRDVARRIETAFGKAGYGELSYYAVPQGFAVVSQLEQFQTDGTPLKEPDRWSATAVPPRVFSLATYIKALFSAAPGHFRVVVFVVTPVPIEEQTETRVSREDALNWVKAGANKLPKEFDQVPFDDDCDCTALVYEFEQKTRDSKPKLRDPGLPARTHLEKGNLLKGLAE